MTSITTKGSPVERTIDLIVLISVPINEIAIGNATNTRHHANFKNLFGSGFSSKNILKKRDSHKIESLSIHLVLYFINITAIRFLKISFQPLIY